MNSFFKYKIEDFSKDVMNQNPAAQTGWIVSAKDVLNDSLENPYFLSLNGMSPAQAFAASDRMSTGIAVVVKEPGAARSEKVYVRPKPGNSSVFGDATGKTGSIPAYGRADMIFSGGNNETPTIVSIDTLQPVVDNTTASGKDIAANTPLSGNINGSIQPMRPNVPMIIKPPGNPLEEIIKKGSSPAPSTPKNPEFKDLVSTAFNIYHNNARTGTTYDPVSIISDYSIAGVCF